MVIGCTLTYDYCPTGRAWARPTGIAAASPGTRSLPSWPGRIVTGLPVRKYAQAAAIVRAQITDGTLKPGQPAPSGDAAGPPHRLLDAHLPQGPARP